MTEQATTRVRGSLRTDVLVAVVATVFCVSGALILGATADEPNLTVVGAIVLVGQCVPLVWRHRSPIVVLFACGVAATVYGVADWPDPLVQLGVFIALATVVECCSRRTAAILWVVSAICGVGAVLLAGDSDAVDIWTMVVVLVFAPLAGDHQRARTAYALEMQARVARAAAEHDRDVRDAQLAERAHLARELHDVVAHHVSMIVVQAEAGASVAAMPDAAGEPSVAAFDSIATTGRRTLGELRTLLGVMRTDGAQRAPTAPQPGLEQLDELIRDMPTTGLAIELSIEGEPRSLPPAIDLSAYRVVQEALTNVVKHAQASRADVLIRYEPQRLTITVADDGTGRSVGSLGASGHGLDGLRERVSLLQGTFAAGHAAGGGFQLDVTLPVEA